MAGKRMLSREVICSDAYVELPFSAQALYIQLNIEADDYGFVDSPRRVSKSIGCGVADFDALSDGGFIYIFPSGVVVILAWWVNNSIQKSRRKMTQHRDELEQLENDGSGAYIPPKSPGRQLCEKKSQVTKKNSHHEKRFSPPKLEEVRNYIRSKGYGVDPDEFFAFYESKGWMIGKNRMVSWHSAVSTWQRRLPSDGGSKKNEEYQSIIAAVG